jgi:hypothetical protein
MSVMATIFVLRLKDEREAAAVSFRGKSRRSEDAEFKLKFALRMMEV